MKLKMFFVGVALLLVTAGVFAGKAKFVAQDVYADVAGVKIKLVSTSAYNDLTTTIPTGGVQAKIVSSLGGGTSYFLYGKDGANFVALYTQSF